jgi:hypothetical protein
MKKEHKMEKVILMSLAAGFGALVIRSLPDLKRYIKISLM